MDPAFYRDEVVGTRVQGPIDYMVGLSHRLGTRVPPIVLGAGATLLGQRLFSPPSVKGWEEGEAWITTANLMQRGNLAGFVLGVVKVEDVLSESDVEAPEAAEPPKSSGNPDEPGGMGMDGAPATEKPATDKNGSRPSGAADPAPPGERRRLDRGKGKGGGRGGGQAFAALRQAEASGWTASINFTARMAKAGARTDADVADRMLDDLLAIRAPDDTRARMREFVARERAGSKIQDGKLLDAGGDAERLLRRLAHLILSLPEAQLE
jgi:hypothetical protein